MNPIIQRFADLVATALGVKLAEIIAAETPKIIAGVEAAIASQVGSMESNVVNEVENIPNRVVAQIKSTLHLP